MKEGKKRQGFMSGLSRLITMKNVLFHSSLSLEKDSPLKLWLKKKDGSQIYILFQLLYYSKK